MIFYKLESFGMDSYIYFDILELDEDDLDRENVFDPDLDFRTFEEAKEKVKSIYKEIIEQYQSEIESLDSCEDFKSFEDL